MCVYEYGAMSPPLTARRLPHPLNGFFLRKQAKAFVKYL
jgi:hypothetical protein